MTRTLDPYKKLPWLAGLALILVSASTTFSGCDWIPYAFLNSIPFKGNSKKNPEVNIYLGVDGLSYHTVQEAIKLGAFSGPEWHLAKFITLFPGTSDASWTRIMHTPKIGGYEIEYYNPEKDEIVNKGILGLAKHITPVFSEGIFNFEFEYLKSFDFRANGYTDGVQAYRDTFVSLADKIDNLFYLLSGRAETSKVFSAYMLEYDVLGHMQTPQETTHALMILANRIKKFRENHPERKINFTLFSDHGMDFIRVHGDHFVKMDDELKNAGITPVTSLSGLDPKSKRPFAIPIMHTRVTYVALHTHPDLVEKVASLAASIPSADIVVAHLKRPPQNPQALDPLEWIGLWTEGKLTGYFGFDSQTNEYYLPAASNWRRFDLNTLNFDLDQDFKILKDDELFALTKNSKYPDLFYRSRTSISTVSTLYPADVLISLRPTYCSLGFSLPGSDDIASAGFHGNLEQLGSLGTLLTNERELPDAVRSENFLELFPKMKEHMQSRGVEIIDGDRNALLHY